MADTLSLRSSSDMGRMKSFFLNDLTQKGIYSSSVLEAMLNVPREFFVSEALRYRAYDDISLPIGFGQTISKPSVIAKMVQCLALCGDERVLEIGTGSGYQSAVISELARNVTTIERIRELSNRARNTLLKLNYNNITLLCGENFEGTDGLYDRIIVAAGAEILPSELFSKLVDGGMLVIPIGDGSGHRIKKFIKKDVDNIIEEEIGTATFVPLIY